MRQSQQSGNGIKEIHVPKLWYYDHMLFLEDQEASESNSTVDSIVEDFESIVSMSRALTLFHFLFNVLLKYEKIKTTLRKLYFQIFSLPYSLVHCFGVVFVSTRAFILENSAFNSISKHLDLFEKKIILFWSVWTIILKKFSAHILISGRQ